MSDQRVVFERDGVRVLADGKCEARWASGEWRPYNDNIPAVSTLARALAESGAKVERLTVRLQTLEAFYQCELEAVDIK